MFREPRRINNARGTPELRRSYVVARLVRLRSNLVREKNREVMKLFLEYDEQHTGGDICAGEESDPWPSHDDAYIHWTPTRLLLHREDAQNWHIEELDVGDEFEKADKAHLVVVTYSDGDTFGHTEGHWAIVGVFATRSKALAIAKKLDATEGKSHKDYRPWEGYFSRYTCADVHSMDIE